MRDLVLALALYGAAYVAVVWAMVVCAVCADAFAPEPRPDPFYVPRMPRTEAACAGFYGHRHDWPVAHA